MHALWNTTTRICNVGMPTPCCETRFMTASSFTAHRGPYAALHVLVMRDDAEDTRVRRGTRTDNPQDAVVVLQCFFFFFLGFFLCLGFGLGFGSVVPVLCSALRPAAFEASTVNEIGSL